MLMIHHMVGVGPVAVIPKYDLEEKRPSHQPLKNGPRLCNSKTSFMSDFVEWFLLALLCFYQEGLDL